MRLAKAKQFADSIRVGLSPYCSRIEIAGSIRRKRAEVNGIDIVLVPKIDLQPIVDRITVKWRQVVGIKDDAPTLRFLSTNDLQLNLFIAHDDVMDLASTTPSNWGSMLLCRTGSLQHNTQLCTHAHTKALKFTPYRGIVDPKTDKIIGSRTEEEIYGALGLKWRPPEEREVLKE